MISSRLLQTAASFGSNPNDSNVFAFLQSLKNEIRLFFILREDYGNRFFDLNSKFEQKCFLEQKSNSLHFFLDIFKGIFFTAVPLGRISTKNVPSSEPVPCLPKNWIQMAATTLSDFKICEWFTWLSRVESIFSQQAAGFRPQYLIHHYPHIRVTTGAYIETF